MTCDKCKKDSGTGRSFTWVLLSRIQEQLPKHYGDAWNVTRYRIIYEPLERLQIHYCPSCFSKARRFQVVFTTVLSLLFLPGGALLLLALYINPPSSDPGRFLVAVAIGILVVGAFGAVQPVLYFKRRGTDWERCELLVGGLLKEIDRRKSEDEAQHVARDWHYMKLEAFQRLGKLEPLSPADCEVFMKSGQWIGQHLSAAQSGQPVPPGR